MTEQKDQAGPFVVALTGGIASGKTAASDAFAAFGVPVIDTDVIARQVVKPATDGLAQVVEAFGDGILSADGHLDRSRLRQHIFSDPETRRRLESILHPLIVREVRNRLAAVDASYAVVVVPLLVESGLFRDADRVLVVDVPEQIQIDRLMVRDGATEQAAQAALDAQVSRHERLEQADDVIENSGTLAQLKSAIADLHRHYLKLAEQAVAEPAPS